MSSTTMDNSLVYTDSYTISQLSATDDGRVIQYEVVINTSLSLIVAYNVTLNVTGECITMYQLYTANNSQTYEKFHQLLLYT